MSCCTKFYNFFLNLDCLGPSPEITHLGQSRYNTLLGTLCTLLALGLSIFSISDQLLNVYNKRSPDIFSQFQPDVAALQFTNKSTNQIGLHFQLEYFDIVKNGFSTVSKEHIPSISVIIGKVTDVFENFNLTNSNDDSFLTDCPDTIFNTKFPNTPSL